MWIRVIQNTEPCILIRIYLIFSQPCLVRWPFKWIVSSIFKTSPALVVRLPAPLAVFWINYPKIYKIIYIYKYELTPNVFKWVLKLWHNLVIRSFYWNKSLEKRILSDVGWLSFTLAWALWKGRNTDLGHIDRK